MPLPGMKVCEYCGCQFRECMTPNPKNKWRWQDHACCTEHGSMILNGKTMNKKTVENKNSGVSKKHKIDTKQIDVKK